MNPNLLGFYEPQTQKRPSTCSIVSVFCPIWCPGEDSNLHAFRHTHLKGNRLPITTPGHHPFKDLPTIRSAFSIFKRFLERQTTYATFSSSFTSSTGASSTTASVSATAATSSSTFSSSTTSCAFSAKSSVETFIMRILRS